MGGIMIRPWDFGPPGPASVIVTGQRLKEYEIWGQHGNSPPELIDTFDKDANINSMMHEYRMAYGRTWTLVLKKVWEDQ